MEYAVMVVLDLDVKVLDSTKASEVEKIAEMLVRVKLGRRWKGEEGEIEVKMLRTKLLGLVEKT